MINIFELGATLTLDKRGFEEGLTGALVKARIFVDALETGARAVIGFGKDAVDTGRTFDKAMGQVAATSGKTVEDLGGLRQQALELGRTTKFTATEAAEAMNILAMAGYDANETMSVMPSTLSLAAAGALSIGEAADITTGILAGFKSENLDMNTAVNELSLLAASAKGSVSDFGAAINTAGAMASSTGQSFESMAVAAGILGNHNMSASEAGNMLNRTLRNLYMPTTKQAKAQKALGLEVYDSSGKARAFQDVLIDLKGALSKMTAEQRNAALSQLFNAATLKSVNFLVDESDSTWNDLTETLRGANDAYDGLGAAAGMAQAQLDNLDGDLTIFNSAMEGFKIALSDEMTPALRDFAQMGTQVLGNLTESIEGGRLSTAIGTIKDAFQRVGEAISPVTDRIFEFVTSDETADGALSVLKTSLDVFVDVLGTAADAVAILIDGVSKVVEWFKSGSSDVDVFTSALLGIGTAVAVWQGFFGLLNGIPAVVTALGTIKGVVTGLIGSAKALFAVVAANPIVAIIALIAGLTVYLVNLYRTNEDFRNKVNEIWENVKTTVTNAVNAIVTFFTTTIPQALDNVKKWFATTWDNIIATMKQWGANVMSFITDTIPQWIESIVQFFLTLPSRIGFALGFALGTLIKWGVDLVNWAKTAIPQFIENVVSWFATLPSRIWTWLVGVINNVIAWGTNMISTGRSAVSNFLSTVVSVISSLPSRIWTWLGQALNRVADWGSNLASKGRSAIQTMISAISSAAASIPSKMAEIGRNIVQGVWKGIQNAKSWFASQVSGFFSGIVSGAKAALGIHSPSKVFAEIGEFMALGLGVGWNDAYDSVKRDIESGLNFDAGEITVTAVPDANGETGSDYNQTVIIQSPQALSPWEVARQTKNATREMLLNFK